MTWLPCEIASKHLRADSALDAARCMVGCNSRDRVTIELRGMRERLNALAAARKTTAAALARKAIGSLLDAEPSDNQIGPNDAAVRDAKVVKVTLRLSAAHATALATGARSADVSQGAYVAGLIDGMPLNPLPPDHTHTVTALVGSTNQLAAMGADLNAFMRLLVRGSSPEIERYRAGILSLANDVRRHLALAALLVAELRSARRSR